MKYRVTFNGVLANEDGTVLDEIRYSVEDALRGVQTSAWALATAASLNVENPSAAFGYAVAVANEAAFLLEVFRHDQPHDTLPMEHLAKVQMITERGCVWPGPGMFFQIEVIPDGP